MNRIEERFSRLRASGQKGLVVYIGAGDPNLAATHQLALEFDRAGVDVLELGVPFSDPLADGIVNQLAAQRGLASGTTPPRVLETVAAIRRDSQIPIVLYIYFNLLHRVGLARFIENAAAAGVDGLLILDLPPEEADDYERLMLAAGMCPVWLIAPTTPDSRIERIARRARGPGGCPCSARCANSRVGPPPVRHAVRLARCGVPDRVVRGLPPSLRPRLSNREKIGMDQFVWDVPAWVVCPGEGVG